MRSDPSSAEDLGQKRRSWYLSPFRLVYKGLGVAATGVSGLVRKGFAGFRRRQRPKHTPYASITGAFLAEEQDIDLSISARPKDLVARFPLLLDSVSDDPQVLLTVGSKFWGNAAARGLLKIKVYDFALYANKRQVQQLCSGQSWAGSSKSHHPDPHLYETIKKAPSLEMTLVLRAARDLPVHLLASEYERILAARFEKAGGTSADRSLNTIIRCISQDKLPKASLTGAAVKKGESLMFKRTATGHMQLYGGGELLGQVHSRLLNEALFDLYVGTVPTSVPARDAAGRTLLSILGDPNAMYQPHHGQRLVCSGPEAESCVIQV